MYPAKVGDFVIVNLSNDKIKRDKEDVGWTYAYQAFLNGKIFQVKSLEEEENMEVLFKLYNPDFGDFLTPREEFLIHYNEEEKDEVETKAEQVHSPKHYNVLEDIEAIQIIAGSMSQDMFKGYCLGNILKYRLRCGAKDDVNQELAKADKYKELFAKYKNLCKEEK